MMMNNWQKVCKQIRPLIKTDVLEDTLHQSFEALLETVLNWDKAVDQKDFENSLLGIMEKTRGTMGY
jgi:hypothetical protein